MVGIIHTFKQLSILFKIIEPFILDFRITSINNKKCPKCNIPHTKRGTFCSRSCANSRGPRSDEFKKNVSAKLKGRVSPRKGTGKRKNYRNIISPITGNKFYSDFWSHPCKTKFLKNISVWFNIPLQTPNTIEHFEKFKKKIDKMYTIDKMSTLEIKEKLNIPLPNGHMPAFVKQLGIKRRSLSEALGVAFLNGRACISKGG